MCVVFSPGQTIGHRPGGFPRNRAVPVGFLRKTGALQPLFLGRQPRESVNIKRSDLDAPESRSNVSGFSRKVKYHANQFP